MDQGANTLEQKFTMPNGIKLPEIGYGCWKVENEKCAELVYQAIKAGYRLIDEAGLYANEVEAGQGIKKALDEKICTREELFVTSKLWNCYHRKEHVKLACKRNLQDLGLEYLDLYLIHFPFATKYVPIEEKYPPHFMFYDEEKQEIVEEFVSMHETWAAMEELVQEGLVKNIGVSNFNVQSMRELLSQAKIKPANLQIELHPYMLQTNLVDFCHKNGITVTAYSSFGAVSYYRFGKFHESESLLDDPVITGIAGTIGKTPAQVLLKWGLQRGTAVIPKSSSNERIAQNFDLYGFTLTEEQMTTINGLDKNRRYNDLQNYGFKGLGFFDN